MLGLAEGGMSCSDVGQVFNSISCVGPSKDSPDTEVNDVVMNMTECH